MTLLATLLDRDSWFLFLLWTNRKWWKLQKIASLLCYAKDIILSRIYNFSARWSSSKLGYWCGTVFGYKTSATWVRARTSMAWAARQPTWLLWTYHLRICENLRHFCSDTICTPNETQNLTSDCRCEHWNWEEVWKSYISKSIIS